MVIIKIYIENINRKCINQLIKIPDIYKNIIIFIKENKI